MKRLTAVLAVTLLAISPAFARTDWSNYKDFTGTRCESPKTIADMVETAKGFRDFKFVSQLSVVSTKTADARPNFLECRVHLSVVYKGQPQRMGGLFTVHLSPNGQWNARFDQQ